MKYPFQNLILEGGGVKGIAYVGALEVLEELGIMKNIKRVGGTSAGAINAVLLALKFKLTDMRQILWNLEFKNFMDDSWGVVRDTARLLERFGWYKGDFFKAWMGNLISEKTGNPNSTFDEFRNKGFLDLYLVGTNLSTGFFQVYSREHTPRMRVVDAVRISMSFPLFFTSVRDDREDVYVDGGVLNNYPIKLFDRKKYIKTGAHARETDYYKKANATKPVTSSEYAYNMETLGFRLDSRKEIAVFRDGAEPQHAHIKDFFDYVKALLGTLMKVQENQHLHSDDWQRTIYIDTLDVGTLDFKLSDEIKQQLVEQGRKGTETYFTWFDTADKPPVNRPTV